MRELVARISTAAFKPVDASSGAVFRIAFGTLAAIAVARFFLNDWIDLIYIEPSHHMKYLWLDWVHPLPALGMQVLFTILGLLAVGIAVGFFYRWCVVLFCIGFIYIELLEATTYLNHYHWLNLTCMLMVLLPLNRKWSIDAWRKPKHHPSTVPALVLWLIRSQLAVVYLFGGIAKLNPDWIAEAMPLIIWLNQHGDYPILGPLLQQTWVAYAMSWAGVTFDLTIMLWMSLDKTRRYAYAVLVMFHLITWQLFPSLGMFHWLMIASTPIFFHPSWPQHTIESVRRTVATIRQTLDIRRPKVSLSAGCGVGTSIPMSDSTPRLTRLRKLAVVACVLVVLTQVAIPLRHWIYPGNVRWTEEGYRYSWRMMLSEKVGYVSYSVTDPKTGDRWIVHPERYLTGMQVERVAIDPDMILQTAHLIADDYRSMGYSSVSVRADAFVSLNGRSYRRIVDPEIDLAGETRTVLPKGWILH